MRKIAEFVKKPVALGEVLVVALIGLIAAGIKALLKAGVPEKIKVKMKSNKTG